MKWTVVLLFLSLTLYGQQKIEWMTLSEALKAQEKEPKKIMLDVYTKWCGYCKMMDSKTFTNRNVIRYINNKFYPVKFDAEGNEEINYYETKFVNNDYKPNVRKGATHPFATFLQVNAYPALIFFDESGDPIFPLRGYYTPEQIEPYLKMIGENYFKTFKKPEDMNNYLKSFRSSK